MKCSQQVFDELIAEILVDAGRCVFAGCDEVGPEDFAVFADELRGEEAAVDRVFVARGARIDGDVCLDPDFTGGSEDGVGQVLIGDDCEGVIFAEAFD